MIQAIINGKIIYKDAILENKILLFDTSIIGIVDALPQGCVVIDACGLYVSAGFIDMHIHGSGGADVMDATPKALETISRTLLATGTTSIVATTMTMATQDIIKALDNLLLHSHTVTGTKIEGIHLEGPFINPQKAGAQDASLAQMPTREWLEPYLDAVRIITLAPELVGAKEFIRSLRASHPHIILSVGHSSSSYEEAYQSFEWGVSHATHLFNAMGSLHHRDVGLVGAILESDITADIIADLVHTHPTMLKIAYSMKKEKLMLITDAMRAGCICAGEYTLGGQKVTVADNKATLESGVLAGSVLQLNHAVKNFQHHTNCTLPQAVAMVTTAPAKKLALPIGELSQGKEANIVLFDSDITIYKVYINGKLKYNSKK